MNEWADLTFGEVMEWYEQMYAGWLALAAGERPPVPLYPDVPLKRLGARFRCALRMVEYIQNHREALVRANPATPAVQEMHTN